MAQPSGNYADTIPLGNVTVMGVRGTVSNVTLNGQAVAESAWLYDGNAKTLSMTGLNNLTASGTYNAGTYLYAQFLSYQFCMLNWLLIFGRMDD